MSQRRPSEEPPEGRPDSGGHGERRSPDDFGPATGPQTLDAEQAGDPPGGDAGVDEPHEGAHNHGDEDADA